MGRSTGGAPKPAEEPVEPGDADPEAGAQDSNPGARDSNAGAQDTNPGAQMKRLLTGPARRPAEAPPAQMPGVLIGEVVGAAEDGRPRVSWRQGPASGAAAQAVWLEEAPCWADCKGLRVVIGFEDGEPAKPLVLGLLDPPPRLADEAPAPTAEKYEAAASVPRSRTITSREELILECGESKIVLRADGSVTILGAKVVSRARTVNKIKGGSVQIN